MRFTDPSLQAILSQWRAEPEATERAKADNLWFEERVAMPRQKAFEMACRGVARAAELDRRQVDYFAEFVATDADVPHTFSRALAPADLGPIDTAQTVVRIEDLTRPLRQEGLSFERLRKAWADDETALIDKFLDTWNGSALRDNRPAFAVFKDVVLDDLESPDWPLRMRDRLGLAHYDCVNGPIPIALMEYSVAEVNAAAAGVPQACAFTAPTVLDSKPWPFFFPAPATLSCGRSMPLFEVADDADLLAEVLHFRITYRWHHMIQLDEIRDPPLSYDLKALRNHHLLALRIASGREDFGEEIP